jgi:magnesium transporter
MGHANTRLYRKGVLETTGFPVEDISDHIAEDDTLVWVDFCNPTREQFQEVADELGLHELAVEDALEPHQRPKLDVYDSHLFLSTHSVRLDEEAGELKVTEIDSFINEKWLITIRLDEGFPMDDVLKRWDRSKNLDITVSYLVYGLLDVVVDGYFTTVTQFDDFYDRISDGIFADEPVEPTRQRHWFEMRRALVKFHRLVGPMRESISSLMRRDHSVVDSAIYPYYQDVYDHVLRVTESTEALRDLVSTIVETNLSLRDYRQNVVMKKVTSWAAIIAVPTLITGYYGMNVRFPGLASRWAWIMAMVLMVGLAGGLYRSFKKREWL